MATDNLLDSYLKQRSAMSGQVTTPQTVSRILNDELQSQYDTMYSSQQLELERQKQAESVSEFNKNLEEQKTTRAMNTATGIGQTGAQLGTLYAMTHPSTAPLFAASATDTALPSITGGLSETGAAESLAPAASATGLLQPVTSSLSSAASTAGTAISGTASGLVAMGEEALGAIGTGATALGTGLLEGASAVGSAIVGGAEAVGGAVAAGGEAVWETGLALLALL